MKDVKQYDMILARFALGNWCNYPQRLVSVYDNVLFTFCYKIAMEIER